MERGGGRPEAASLRGLVLTILVLVGLMLLSGAASPARGATALACGEVYTVERGDTLYRIAERVYGAGWHFEAILARNARETIRLDIGDQLLLPCLADDGTPVEVPGFVASGFVPASDRRAAVSVHAFARPGFGGLAGATLPGGGLMTDLLSQALQHAAPGYVLSVEHREVPESQLNSLENVADSDLGFPWIMPDCNAPAADPVTRAKCADFVFSEPVLTIPVRFFIRRGAPALNARRDLAGRRVCQPADAVPIDLAEAGLIDPGTVKVDATTARQCLRMLRDGRVDAVALSAAGAAALETGTDAGGGTGNGTSDGFVEAPGLAASPTLHAIAPKANPEARLKLALLNQGLRSLMSSGQWFETVLEHRNGTRKRLAVAE